MLYETTNNRYKYKFHLNIEKGDFSIFQNHSPDSVFSQYRNSMIDEHSNHTTIKSLMIYFHKNFKKREIHLALDKWEELKNFDIDFNKQLKNYAFTYDYHSPYDNIFHSIKIPFTNFTSLATYEFSNKLPQLTEAVIQYAIENTDLSKIPPIYMIKETKDNQFLTQYLMFLKDEYPNINLGDGIFYLNPETLMNSDIYLHFVSQYYQNEETISYNMFEKIIKEFSVEQLSYFLNESKAKFGHFLPSVENIFSEKSSKIHTDFTVIFDLLLDNLEKNNFDFSTLYLSSFENIGTYDNLFKRLIKLGIDYTQELNYRMFDSKNFTKHISNLLKYKLWNFDTKNDDGLTYLEYHQKRINHLPENERGYPYVLFSERLSNLLHDILSYSVNDPEFTPIINFDFLDKVDDKIKSIFYYRIINSKIMDEQILIDFFKGDILNGVIDFILSSEDKSYYGPISLISQKYPTEYYIQNEEDHFSFCNKLEKLNSKNTIYMLIDSLKYNSKQDYLDKNYDFYYNFFLKTFLKSSQVQGFNFDFESFYKTNTFFEKMEKNTSTLKHKYDRVCLLVQIIEIQALAYSNVGSQYNNMNKRLTDFLDLYKTKKIQMEKVLIDSSIINKIDHSLSSKPRI